MEGSVLIVTVIEARDLEAWETVGTIDPFAILECEGQKIQTGYVPNTKNPIWNE